MPWGSRGAQVPPKKCLFLYGEGYRAVAHVLNGAGIPSPRGSGWSPAAIYELVRNPIYRGDYIWNRSEWIKDHDTGRRRRYERPESEWVHHPGDPSCFDRDVYGHA